MKRVLPFLAICVLASTSTVPAYSQVAPGLLDPNVATEAQLGSLPHMTPALVKMVMGRRPFVNIVELDTLLRAQGMTADQARALYGKAFIHVNLNTGSREEILCIPGAGRRMAHEFDEYRPWKAWVQFDKEISKYVGQAETDRLKRYVFIPIDPNTATDAIMLTIPGADEGLVKRLKLGRPWKTNEQFDKALGKDVNAREIARIRRYLVIG